MKASLQFAGCLFFLFFLIGGRHVCFGQEPVARPADGTPIKPDDAAAGGDQTANRIEHSQYILHGNRWWYLLPNNRWVVWDGDRWVEPPRETVPAEISEGMQYHRTPHYVGPGQRLLQPRPRSWYFSGGVYDGPYYYFDEFYKPYGGARPYPYFPDPRPKPRRAQ